jgi:hypothetical protein
MYVEVLHTQYFLYNMIIYSNVHSCFILNQFNADLFYCVMLNKPFLECVNEINNR